MGYAGGTSPHPTYRRIGDHTETIQIEYDPAVISYGDLIRIFWESHNPHVRAWSRQYMSVVFVHDEEQAVIARETSEALAQSAGLPVLTEIREYEHFYSAEAYHQKYYLQNRREIFDAAKSLYPTFGDFVDSTTAARMNAYVAGYGSEEQFEREMGMVDLPEEILVQLRRMAEVYWD